jgi:hypothetical protein
LASICCHFPLVDRHELGRILASDGSDDLTGGLDDVADILDKAPIVWGELGGV